MATAIEVIITQDCDAGQAGEIAKVKPGYARNFLLPKGFAIIADSEAIAEYEERKVELERVAQEKRDLANNLKDTLGEEASITVSAKAGESGKLFGSITKEKIAEAANSQLNLEITKEAVKIKEPIKELCETTVSVDLGSKIMIDIALTVISA